MYRIIQYGHNLKYTSYLGCVKMYVINLSDWEGFLTSLFLKVEVTVAWSKLALVSQS